MAVFELELEPVQSLFIIRLIIGTTLTLYPVNGGAERGVQGTPLDLFLSIFVTGGRMLAIGDPYEYDFPEVIDTMGPQWPACIHDALSIARGHFLAGVNPIWIYSNYRGKLQELIDQKTWRSADAALFTLALDRAYASKLSVSVMVAVPA